VVFGIAGRFWRPNGDLRPLPDREAFAAFAEEGCVKAAWNLQIRPSRTSPRECELSTETRMRCFGAAARRKFGCYWALIGPFSGLLRKALLSGIRRRAETAAE